MAKPKYVWMVRAGNDNELAPYLGHYEALEPEFQSKVPLRKVWLPTD